MPAKNSPASTDAPLMEREVTLTRVFDAPRDLVFAAWTDPRHMAQWFGPKNWTNPVCEIDVKPGAAWRIVMRSPHGDEYPCAGVYREIVAPERLAFTNNALDAAGNLLLEGLTTVIFAEENGKTTGPYGFTITIHEMDVRPGGHWRFIMHGPDGVDYLNENRYLEIVKPERLVFLHGPAPKFQATVTLENANGKTLLTMRTTFATAEEREWIVKTHNAMEGAEQTLARLVEFLEVQS